MDHEEILNKAVDNLISKIKLNDKNFQNIINFSFEKTYDDKNWDVTYDLQNVAQLLFDESHNSEISSLKDFNSEDFENLINELKSNKTQFEISKWDICIISGPYLIPLRALTNVSNRLTFPPSPRHTHM